ncbi:ligand-binding sensor domain-containing protein [Marinigracilibium pacificum]|uniref:Two component regulator with propeller domain n=1 Tax=Marinigracilibium pacificum TaxID=2729599 RepID=A0A848J4J9_9BACT|nr:two-component regulator propeller domain-containing protein [Marinigracilibium pacificum]NMM50681.1 hypothetical protein [Marinigracilibium pacificum]
MYRQQLISAILLLCLAILSCQKTEDAKPNVNTKDNSTESAIVKAESFFVKQFGAEFGIQSEQPEPIAQYVRRIYKDTKDNFWFGTNSLGLGRFDGRNLAYFSTKDGLSGNQITGIIEDHNGNIWMSTNGGVSMFDGKRFTNYTTEQGLTSNYVWSIFEDSKGIIWAGTGEGLCNIDPSSELDFSEFNFPKVKVQKSIPNKSAKRVSSIIEDNLGNLWFATDGLGVWKYNPTDNKKEKFTHFTQKDGLCGNSILSIIQDKNGNFWFGSRYGGISQYDGNSFKTFNSSNGYIGNDEVCAIYEDSKGNIWFSSEGYGIYRFDGKKLKIYGESEGLPIRAVQTIFEDNDGMYWIGGGSGLYLFDGNNFIHVSKNGPWGMC